MSKPSKVLEYVLCDSAKKVCVPGSPGDMKLLGKAIQEIKEYENYSQHVHVRNSSTEDSCKICGLDLRHSIHV